MINQTIKITSALSTQQEPWQNILYSNETLLKTILLIAGGVLSLAAATQLIIPLTPVPLTFQTATVLLIAMMYGAKRGTAVVFTYLSLGALGLPILSNSSGGLHYFSGPTAGYLFGFLIATPITGYLAEIGFARNVFLSFIAALVGSIIIFSCGVLVLTSLFGFKQALIVGVMPFVISEPLKLLAVAAFAPRFWRRNYS